MGCFFFFTDPTQAKLYKHRRWLEAENELYYLCIENKGADQLRSYREADLRLHFCLYKLLVFSRGGPFTSFQSQDSLEARIMLSSFLLYEYTFCLCFRDGKT